jgi:alpha-amylase
MLWGDGDTVKDPVGTTYGIDKQINGTVASQLEDENSLLSHYAKVINVRTKYPAIARGEYNMVSSTNKNFAGFYVEYNGEILGIIHNNSLNEISMPLSDLKGLDGHSFDQLCEILGSSAKLEDGVLTIAAYTSVILK